MKSITIAYSVKLTMANHAQDTQRILGMLFQAGVGHDVLAEVAKVLESKDKQIKQQDGEISTALNDIQELNDTVEDLYSKYEPSGLTLAGCITRLGGECMSEAEVLRGFHAMTTVGSSPDTAFRALLLPDTDSEDSEDDEPVITTRHGTTIKGSDITIAQTRGSEREI